MHALWRTLYNKVKDSQSQWKGVKQLSKSVTDIIEHYLKTMIEQSERGKAEIKRNEIAEKFECVPSQINYVIKTRFTTERGYAVESKRGGGGYIRIYRIQMHTEKDLLDHVIESVRHGASTTMAEDIIRLLYEEDIVTEREARLMLAVTSREVLRQPLPERDMTRGRLLQVMVETMLYERDK